MSKRTRLNISHNSVFLLFTILVFSFVTYPGAVVTAEEPIVWYFNGYPIIFAFILAIVCLLSPQIHKYLTCDRIVIYHFLSCIVCLIPLIYVNNIDGFSSHYPVVLYTLVTYIIARSCDKLDYYNFQKIFILFGLILSIQVLLTYQGIPCSYVDFNYKAYMRIPIAASNVIASYLVPIFYLYYFNIKKRNIVIIALFILAIFLTKSRGGVVCLIFTYIIYLFTIKYKYSNTKRLMIIITCAIITFILLSIPVVQTFFMGFYADKENLTANELSSGRLDLYYAEFERALKYPLFGNGLIFNNTTSFSGSHNLFVELFVQRGIIGTLLYLVPIGYVLRKGYQNITKPGILGWVLFLIAILLHGMIELNFFNYSADLMFWFGCGVIINLTKKN